MAGLYSDDFVERLRRGAASLASEWGLSPQTEVRLLEISENATFRADDPHRDEPVILRVHRPGYHTRREIESELAWLDAIRGAGVTRVAPPIERRMGGHVASFDLEGDARDVVAFEFLPGAAPSEETGLVDGFRDLGAISARLHAHAQSWSRPEWFKRKRWIFDTIVGRSPHWGDWRAGLGMTTEGRAILERAADVMESRLGAYGIGEERFGLIHADLRLANLLVHDGQIAVIDFDDCGFGWFAFDFAAAISFIETDPTIPALQSAWVEGYRTVAPLEDTAEAEIDTFIMLRRLQLTAWIASHSETPTAQEMGPDFTVGTIEMAERYLNGHR